ncbi:MAG: transporter related protein [Gemmataceae bacterium]|nr:transporter related protein [Gemmataceae bacterium]
MQPAISVRGVSKRFHLGSRGHQPYLTFRDAVVSGVRAARRWAAETLRLAKPAAPEGDEVWAVNDVSFDVNPGEVVGIVGRNGAGKSTLLKLMSRITSPTRGEILLRGRVGSLLEVGTGFHPELTGRENVYLNGSILGMRRQEIERKFDEIVAFAEVERFLDTPVKRYSSGMYVRLAFAVAAHLEPEVLLVDEVLAVGDMAFQRKCLGKMGQVSRLGRTVLFVSHNMTAVKALCGRAVLIEGGRAAADGPVDEVVDRYLTGGLDTARTGTIPEHAPRHTDRPGEAYFRSARLTDLAGQPLAQVYFGQPFRVHFECDVVKGIPDGLFEVSISTQDGIHVTQATTLDGGAPPRHLGPGRHTGSATFEGLTLIPRSYTIDLGVHHWDGATADHVQRTLDFTVLRMAESGDDHYPWPMSRGFVRPKVAWVGTNPS